MEPTFVIAGGQRSGTTSLVRLLDQHPEIYMARPGWPEPKYFVDDPQPGRDRDWYLQTWFSDTGPARAVGEKSTSYLESVGAARRMKEQFPRLKTAFILRHPAERAISNYLFSVRNGRETLSLDEALQQEPARGNVAGVSVSPFAYVRRGKYALDLEQYFEHFPASDRLVLLHDDLVRDAGGLSRRLFEFLGVDPAFQAAGLSERHNSRPADAPRFSRDTIEWLIAQFGESNRHLERLLDRDLSRWSTITPDLEGYL